MTEREILIEQRREELEAIIENARDANEVNEIENFIYAIKKTKERDESEKHFNQEFSILNKLLKKLEEDLPIAERRKEIKYLENKKCWFEDNIRKLEKEEYNKRLELQADKNIVLRKLKTDERNVFKIKSLNKKEIEILKKEGYKTINEYCVYEQKVIPVLVRKFSNHTSTHIFLVWSVRKLLESIQGIKNIKEHGSVEPDLTFNFQNKKYAIEIECGSLIKKPKQMSEKQQDLKHKFGSKWFVVISNRNLLKKYKNFGRIATRKNTKKVLFKMLNLLIS